MRTMIFAASMMLLVATATADTPLGPAQTSSERQVKICAEHALKAGDAPAGRIKEVSAAKMSKEQSAVVERMTKGPRGCVFGPFAILLHSPKMLSAVQELGTYLRYDSVLPPRVRELAILVVGRLLPQRYIWYVHEPIARASGVTEETVQDLAAGQRPRDLNAEGNATYKFVVQLMTTRTVDDAALQGVEARFGDKGVVELTGLFAYFSLLGLEMNVAGTPTPDDYPVLFQGK